jgi:hypothetical protein
VCALLQEKARDTTSTEAFCTLCASCIPEHGKGSISNRHGFDSVVLCPCVRWQVELLVKSRTVLPGHNGRVQAIFTRILRERGVKVNEGDRSRLQWAPTPRSKREWLGKRGSIQWEETRRLSVRSQRVQLVPCQTGKLGIRRRGM